MANHSGQFKPGQSGNKAGRPKGIHTKYAKYRKQIDSRATDLIDNLIEIALSGDVTAHRVLLDRVYPATAEKDLHMEARLDEIENQLGRLEQRK